MCDALPPQADCPDKAPRNKDVESPRREKRKLSGGRTGHTAENPHLETSEAV